MSDAKAERHWRIADPDAERTAILGHALGVPALVAHLLVRRGCTTPEAAENFLNVPLAALHEPRLMHGMAVAV